MSQTLETQILSHYLKTRNYFFLSNWNIKKFIKIAKIYLNLTFDPRARYNLPEDRGLCLLLPMDGLGRAPALCINAWTDLAKNLQLHAVLDGPAGQPIFGWSWFNNFLGHLCILYLDHLLVTFGQNCKLAQAACVRHACLRAPCVAWPLLSPLFSLSLFLSSFFSLCLLLLTHFGESPMCEIIFHPIFWHN